MVLFVVNHVHNQLPHPAPQVECRVHVYLVHRVAGTAENADRFWRFHLPFLCLEEFFVFADSVPVGHSGDMVADADFQGLPFLIGGRRAGQKVFTLHIGSKNFG